eukprot:Plantae.Rhodophyta-Hildenbrandia_rubra.ctg2862.p2 GENE.Plantae.Rhodophyta-Hildenbrandia_rubra.ctg2862~~Plantae.Rhodophyta-Hildenbrandia_rubra.ctg2862.p2  ORF type:complete len:497 (+),score=98.19 Plantae.Rhodophyta-Hildenbrandia_rubra.ctg2862:6395-7885(+)
MPSIDAAQGDDMMDLDINSEPDGLSQSMHRAVTNYEDASRRFLRQQSTYSPQYSQLYFARLNQMRNRVSTSARSKWGQGDDVQYAERVLSAAEQVDKDVVIIGILFKNMALKPGILKEYAKMDGQLIPAPPGRSTIPYVGDGDNVIIEDETGRAALDLSECDIGVGDLVTGFVVAVRGRASKKTGSFQVNGMCCAGMKPQAPLSELESDKYVCLISGLGFGDPTSNNVIADLLVEYLKGNLGDGAEERRTAQIARIIVAGNIICLPEETADGAWHLNSYEALDADGQRKAAAPIREADAFLNALSSVAPVDLMPGENDPTNFQLPQQPLHQCLFPSSSKNVLLNRVTNPYESVVEGRRLLGSAGQNVDDYALYAPPRESDKSCIETPTPKEYADNALMIMESMLRNGLMAPTAPDTLSTCPFYDQDPFEINDTPHVFFTGNQAAFGTRIIEETNIGMKRKVRLIAVPRFSEAGQAALLNLKTMECQLLELATAIPG